MGIKEDLDMLDSKISKLRADYEQYFVKTLKKEPSALRDEIDRLILRYSNQRINSTSLRFRYSTLTSKYTSYKQFWSRILRQIEEGTYERGAAFGAKMPAAPVIPEPSQRPEANPSPSGGLKEKLPAADDKFKTVYQQFMEAKKTAGESIVDMSYEKFTQAIAQQTEKVKKDLNCNDVEYKVVVKDGKAKITLVPKK
ncbi:MAG: hypothetical protein HY026_10235 [Deltaproteobacteria bacterium]|nr:hypothetical protein [Deltaproteobacteria bacterium]